MCIRDRIQKRRLPAIPEEDEATATRRPKVEVQSPSAAKTSPGGSPPQENVQLGQRRHQDFYRNADEEFRGVFDQLNLTPDFELFEASPASTDDDEPVFPPLKTEPQSPMTPKPAPPSPKGIAAGPPSQRTRQMEKDFANTQYKRLLEAEALEKKKKKELAR